MSGDTIRDGSGYSRWQARIPQTWMAEPRILALSDSAFRVWVALWSYADGGGTNAFPCYRTLGELTGRSRRSVFRAIAELQRTHEPDVDGKPGRQLWTGPLMTKTRRHGPDGEQKSNAWTLVDPTTVRPVG